ncbi:MAG: tRNA pseudouridine(38-40) synthase TruA [Bacteroidaceae bacterium]|nr:tRNA pseudouridine(38-40) synthase TruA [Bacteroidaceae bacterium]
MSRYFIQLSYDGTAYHGWQVQPNGVSVQETLQQALSTILRQPIEIVGAGRTDAGVHAQMMVAHFDYQEKLDEGQLVYKTNKLLPPDIAVQRVYPVSEEMHARFSATSRTYHYYIHTKKSPFQRHYSWQITYPLDFDRMNEAAARLLDYKDFTSFSKTQTDTKTNICHITEARWITSPIPSKEGEEGSFCFTITANRFLRNMVRAIVGTLIEVGRGRMTVEEFCRVIEGKDRCSAGESVPGHGLFLVDISYDLKDSKDFKEQ